MALDIWVGDWNEKGSKLTFLRPRSILFVLCPIFEDFEKEKGIMIDPYDGARFDSQFLDQVDELASKAESLVLSQPREFDVYMGTNLGTTLEPKNEEIYFTVKRSEFIDFIKKWESAIRQARESRKPYILWRLNKPNQSLLVNAIGAPLFDVR